MRYTWTHGILWVLLHGRVSVLGEGAYVTASIVFLFISIEILASFYIPKEHVHLKPIKSDIHDECDDV